MAGQKRKRSTSTEADQSEEPQQRGTLGLSPAPEWKCVYPDVKVVSEGKAGQSKNKLAEHQIWPFQPEGSPPNTLDQYYVVTPDKEFSKMRRYRNIINMGEKYSSKEYVWVNNNEGGEGKNLPAGDNRNFWVARILEFRAKSASQVYARSYWLYWPDDLPNCQNKNESKSSGRRPYHGKHELIASNHMDVIDVTTFAGKASVRHWVEEDDNDPAQSDLYWRQTFDHRSGQLSEVRHHCICKSPYNPDKLLVGCSKTSCHLWMHDDCIIDAVLQKTYDNLPKDDEVTVHTNGTPSKNGKGQKTKQKKDVKKDAKPYEGIFKATIDTDGTPRIVITDLRANADEDKKTWVEDISCLKCGSKVT